MSGDFVGCYIAANISLSTLRGVLQKSGKFDDWELIQGSDFKLKESYGYQERFEKYELLLEALAKRSVIAENKQLDKSKPSLIWNNALLIADVLTLLSIARAKYYHTILVERQLADKYTLSFGVMTSDMSGNRDIVPLSNLGQFVSEALTLIEHNRNWLKESGFLPSIYWYEQAQQSHGTAPSILEMALYWVSIEILATSHAHEHGSGIKSKKERVKHFIEDKGYADSIWGFIEEVVDDWYKARCSAFHEGKEPLDVKVLKTRRQQARDFVSLVLVEMLQKQEVTTIEQIVSRMQSY
jgi:hypothetical protein